VTDFTPRVDQVEVTCLNVKEALVKEDARFENLQRIIISLQDNKVESDKYRKDQTGLNEQISAITKQIEKIVNEQKTMENWIEKYEPLKVQHQITETLGSCLSRKAKQKLGEYDLSACDAYREKILSDHGNPSIKQKILDLLSQLEAESREMVA
jgi:NCAIR mutase (PurE)-related protein